MGAESSVQRDGKTEEDAPVTASASGGELSAEVTLLQEGDQKPLQKNGQISSLSSLNGHSEDHTLAEVGQPDGVSVAQKEEAPETMDTTTEEVTPQVNSEKVEKESPDANGISAVEEKAAEEKPDDTNEVGFKKIFRFVGFKFTLKKDKSEEKDPVKLLTVKDKEVEEEVNGADEAPKEEAATAEETVEEKVADAEVSTAEAEVTENAESPEAETTDEVVKGEGAEKEEGESSPPAHETTISPFRKLFSGGLFSNLRKKASIRKTKEEEEKEAGAEAEKTEEVEAEENKEKVEEKQEAKEEEAATKEEEKVESKEEEPAEVTSTGEAEAAAATAEPEEKKQEESLETSPVEGAAAELVAEAELTSSQEKVKLQASPLKKLFTGAGLKKLSTKKQKSKKDAEAKESGEPAEQLQSSTESEEGVKADSGASSPEESGEHVIDVEVTQAESSQEVEGEVATDGEKKKEGIIAWSSFKKLVTPKKRVKRPSESEDEAAGEKTAKSATLSSSESAPLADKSVEEEAQEEKATEEEKTENTEKLVSSTEEPKKKMDTSVSWEALMCMGGPKKRTRKTSDSEDEETKIEEENQQDATEVQAESKTEAAITASQVTESEGEVGSSCEPQTSSTEKESAWDTLKRMVKPKNKAKAEEKAEESPEQVQSDGETPKDESSFSLKKFFPGRRKKKMDKQSSTGQSSGEEDSDTPAVVPLSEYEEKAEDEKEKSTEVAEVQEKVSVEDRSPSWISATLDVVGDKQEDLSDIPEENDNVTAKSADTDTQDDDTEDIVPPPKLSARRLSTAEVKPLAPAPPAETTAVAKTPNSESVSEVNGAIPAQISEIAANISVALEDAPIDAAAETTEADLPAEIIETKTNTLLEPHVREEATAICIGLGTEEIASIPAETPVAPVREDAAEISNATSTEVALEEKPKMLEEATATEDPLLKAQVSGIETTDLEVSAETEIEKADIECAAECSEPIVEKAGVCTTAQEACEVVQLTSMSENSPSAVIVDPITPTSETTICTQNVEVTELTVETKEEEKLVAGEENTAVNGVIEVLTKEISSTTSSTMQTNQTEPTITVVKPNEQVCVITESIVLVAPLNQESEQVASLENEEGAEENNVEAHGMVIGQVVIQEAIDKVSDEAPQPPQPSTPSATIPTPDKAVETTEEEFEILDAPLIQDTPVPIVCEKPAPKPIHLAMEVCDTIPLEVTSSLDGTLEEENKPEKELKTAVEVKVSAETIAVEEVVEIQEEKDVGGELEDIKEEEENVQETEEEKKVHMPVQVVLQTAEMIEEQTVEEEATVEFDSSGPVDSSAPAEGSASENQVSESVSTQPEETQEPAEKMASVKCAEVMAQVIEVIEEAVKEIEPATTEITTAS